MKIAIDGRVLLEDKPAGIGIYAREIIKELACNFPTDTWIVFALGGEETLKRLPEWREKNIRVVKKEGSNSGYTLGKFLGIAPSFDDLLGEEVDGWLVPNANSFWSKKPYALVVHDTWSEKGSESFPLKHRIKRFLVKEVALWRGAEKILTVSKTTADDLKAHFPNQKTVVTPLGVDEEIFVPRERSSDRSYRAAYDLNRPYFLSVATREPRKNTEAVIEAFLDYKRLTANQERLVLVGKWWWEKNKLKEKLKLEGVVMLNYVPRQHLGSLFRGATAFIFPSFYEGFGLPVAEAASCNVKIIASVHGAIPEVLGDNFIGINAWNKSELAEAMVAARSLERRGEKRFSWKETASLTAKALQEMVLRSN